MQKTRIGFPATNRGNKVFIYFPFKLLDYSYFARSDGYLHGSEEYEASLAAAYLANHDNQGPVGMNIGMFARYFLMRDTQQGTLHRRIRRNEAPAAIYLENPAISMVKQSVFAELDILARTAALRAAAYAWAREELGRAQGIYSCLINEIEEM